MADVGGGSREHKEMQLAELEVQLAQQLLNHKSQTLRIKQLQLELSKVGPNQEATSKAIEELKTRISTLNEELANVG